MIWPHPACLPPDVLLSACELRRGRDSGPGGQHRNKVETAVTLHHRPTGVRARAAESRSPQRNREAALSRLRHALAVAVRSTEVPTEPSELWVSRCRGGRVVCSDSHEDFPALLAEALDTLAAEDWDGRGAAARLRCSATQLVRLLGRHAPALVAWNARRAERGLHPLR